MQISKQIIKAARGRPFIKGQVANPGGRPAGLPDRRTQYRQLIEARMPELIERCVNMAVQGDMQAMRLCLERVLPAVRAGDEAVNLPFIAGVGLGAKAQGVLQAAFDDQIAPSVASTLINAIAGSARAIELDELTKRLEALEASFPENKSAH